MFEAVFAVQNITDLVPTPIGVGIADRAVALWAPWFFRAAAKDERRLQAIVCLPSRRRIAEFSS
jgi:hypothetical protein